MRHAIHWLVCAGLVACSAGTGGHDARGPGDDGDTADATTSDVPVPDVPAPEVPVPDVQVPDVPDVAALADTVPPDPGASDAAAGDPGDGSDLADPGPDLVDVPPDLPPAGPPYRPSGWIRVTETLTSDPAYRASVSIAMLAGPLPTSQVVVASEGECTLLEGSLSMFCTPSCEPGQACIDGACVSYPAPAPAGRITISGLAQPFVLDPDAQGSYPIDGLPSDLFDAGDAVHATAEGGATPAFDLSATGVPDLATGIEDVVFVPGQDFVATWTPPVPAVPGARIRLLIETGWHGASSLASLWCETDDDGELTIPASLTARIEVPSCGKCERSSISRFTRDVVDLGAGPIVLEVSSVWSFIPWW